MIVAKLKDAADYRGIHPMLDKALEYLNDEFMNTVGSDKAPAHQSIILRHGDFLVAFPQDAHRVKGQVSGPSDVRKVVFKIRIA